MLKLNLTLTDSVSDHHRNKHLTLAKVPSKLIWSFRLSDYYPTSQAHRFHCHISADQRKKKTTTTVVARELHHVGNLTTEKTSYVLYVSSYQFTAYWLFNLLLAKTNKTKQNKQTNNPQNKTNKKACIKTEEI